MASEEEYLDSLLKNMIDSEPVAAEADEMESEADLGFELDEIEDFETASEDGLMDDSALAAMVDALDEDIEPEEEEEIAGQARNDELIDELADELMDEAAADDDFLSDLFGEEEIAGQARNDELIDEEIDEAADDDFLSDLFGEEEIAGQARNDELIDEETDELMDEAAADDDIDLFGESELGQASADDMAALFGEVESSETTSSDDFGSMLDGVDFGGDSDDSSGSGDDLLTMLDGMPGLDGFMYDDAGEGGDVMAMLTEVGDAPIAEKKKSKKAKGKKKDKGAGFGDDELVLSPEEFDAHLSGEGKVSLISRIISALTDADDETETLTISGVTAENLEELEKPPEEEEGKKEKKKKEKKVKEAKPPKEKKPKKEKPPKEEEKPSKRLSKKNVLMVFTFSLSFMAAMIALTLIVPDYLERQVTKSAFEAGDNRTLFRMLYARNRNTQDEIIFRRAEAVLRINRRVESYANFTAMGQPIEALNALILGISRYDEMMGEDLYGAEAEVMVVYREILAILAGEYGISEADARELLDLSGEEYTMAIHELVRVRTEP
ncbi:MAG: hypothetical protein LBC96_02770 [Lachnospiraceae bacterium]|nr:hypothetical protein [Lachnospiraceae bacterium]